MMSFLFSFFNLWGSIDPPFAYDLHLSSLPGTNGRTMICFHGYGDNYKIASALKDQGCNSTLVSFNFPEYDIKQGRAYDPSKATFGTIEELLPALYVLKKTILDQELESIDLYGFSAGGGALINVLKLLNTSNQDKALKKIRIGSTEKNRLIAAIEKGIVILDTPLKSIEEIIEFRGSTEELEILAKKYRDNNLRPIDSIEDLKGLSLNILLHFQEEDEVLSNRDDSIYIEKLKASQTDGKVTLIMGNDGGHAVPHTSLWIKIKNSISQ